MECPIEQAKFFYVISSLLDQLEAEGVGGATTKSLRELWRDDLRRSDLQLDLAIVLDATTFLQKTYRLECDRLEALLVVDDIEAIREKGKALGSSVSS